ncbi:amidohydrolase family protein [Stenotrophomonas sp. NPDC077659]|uniref:amidohydrolase family protein n=1 Tax=Stenotrophomonas sp. NPDC077659 TaxID=3390694 RepID=UPI003D041712
MISVFSSRGVTGLISGRLAIDLPMGPWGESTKTLRQAAERRIALDVQLDSDGSIQALRNVIDALAQDHELRPLRWSVAGRTSGAKSDMQFMAAHGLPYALESHRTVDISSDQAIASGALVCSDTPVRSALGAGLTLVGGTEFRTGEAIWREIQCLVDSRLHAVSSSGGSHLITREAALRIFTRNAAWISFSEADRGSLTTGKFADLVVLDQPYLTMPAGRIHTIRSLLTMGEGRVVFEAESLNSE